MLAGGALRLWTILSPAGVFDSDSAVVGLMARHYSVGESFAFYWGQAYGGTHEAMLAAPVLKIGGSSPLALQLVPAASSGVAAVLIWLIGRETVGSRPALVAGLLFWLWPAGFIWWSVKLGGDYWPTLVFALAAVLVMVLLAKGRRDGPGWFLLLGLLVGLAWWGNPQAVPLLAPAALWHIRLFVGRPRMFLLVIVGALVGASPWLAYNFREDFLSLEAPPPDFGYFERLGRTLSTSAPMALGLRVPFTKEWLVPPPVYWLAFVAVAFGVARRPKGTGLLLFVLIVFPFLLAIAPLTGYVDQPRYLLFVAPVIALLVARLVTSGSTWLAPVTLVVAGALSVVALAKMSEGEVTSPFAPDVPVPRHLGDAQRLMKGEGVTSAFADYWIAYRLTFESRERLIVSPTYSSRYEKWNRHLRDQPAPAYLFLARSRVLPEFLGWCDERKLSCPVTRRGAFALVRPSGKLLPEEKPNGWVPT